jgi:3-dehydroquinate dehydratase type I
MICLSLVDLSFAQILKLLPECELLELRLDRLDLVEPELELILQKAAASLVCFPGTAETLPQRYKTLDKALRWGADYVDCSAEDDSTEQQNLIHHARSLSVKVIYSYHNYMATPELSELQKIASKAFSRGADICKIVTLAKSKTDIQNLMSLYSYAPRMIAFGMGEKAAHTRILALEKGAPFVYAALDEEHLAAPGQMTLAQLQKAFGEARPDA